MPEIENRSHNHAVMTFITQTDTGEAVHMYIDMHRHLNVILLQVSKYPPKLASLFKIAYGLLLYSVALHTRTLNICTHMYTVRDFKFYFPKESL